MWTNQDMAEVTSSIVFSFCTCPYRQIAIKLLNFLLKYCPNEYIPSQSPLQKLMFIGSKVLDLKGIFQIEMQVMRLCSTRTLNITTNTVNKGCKIDMSNYFWNYYYQVSLKEKLMYFKISKNLSSIQLKYLHFTKLIIYFCYWVITKVNNKCCATECQEIHFFT